jgi:hypothetical protein
MPPDTPLTGDSALDSSSLGGFRRPGMHRHSSKSYSTGISLYTLSTSIPWRFR